MGDGQLVKPLPRPPEAAVLTGQRRVQTDQEEEHMSHMVLETGLIDKSGKYKTQI